MLRRYKTGRSKLKGPGSPAKFTSVILRFYFISFISGPSSAHPITQRFHFFLKLCIDCRQLFFVENALLLLLLLLVVGRQSEDTIWCQICWLRHESASSTGNFLRRRGSFVMSRKNCKLLHLEKNGLGFLQKGFWFSRK
jgi:hypothetical protein